MRMDIIDLEEDFQQYKLGKGVKAALHNMTTRNNIDEHEVEQLWEGRHYTIWGMPFYNEVERKAEFEEAFKEYDIVGLAGAKKAKISTC